MDILDKYTVLPFSNRTLNSSSTPVAQSGFSSAIYIVWDVLYGLLSVTTVIGNTLILMCLSKFRDSTSSIHILIGNLAVSDLIMGGLLLPYCIILDAMQLNSEKYLCLVKVSLIVFAIGISAYGLLLVSIDRFSAVCFPFKHHKTLSSKKVLIMLAIGWTYVAIFAFLPLSGWNFYDVNLPYSCTQDKVLTPIYAKVMNGHFILLLSINFILYIIVIRISMKKARKVYATQKFASEYRANMRELYRVKTMAMVQGLFAVCWFPYVSVSIAITFTENQVLQQTQYWCVIPGLLNSAVNWIVYGYRNEQLRRQFKKHFKCICRF
ncbi:adenosine receptor A2b-like [Mercenaria mercenaria]|uniref:adenosine receptor A2b-like n=1 Tax=Mercenaria mercenaria TaxID=6596 RepID=UPI00234F3449|nr:adenosine receptor A2b-like [Mercenaria mercenaria]